MNELEAPPAPVLEPSADELFVMPASVAQKRFWMLEQMSPGNTALNIPVAFELRGPLDAGILERALQAIVDRHESLRTHFEVIDGEPRQVIAARSALTLHRLAEEPGATGDRAERIRLVMNREACRALDFNRSPLMRAALLELASDDHVLMLTIHHIICDGWSTGLLVRELAAFYDAIRRDEPPHLAPLSIQYADYVLWQEGWLKTPEFQQQLDYWRGQLETGTAPLDFPTNFVRRGGQSTVAVLETRLLPPAVTDALKRVCQEEGVTLFMIFLSAYAALLHRYTGQSRILVGTTAANRGRAELEPIVGLFANLLSVPADVHGAMTFRELLLAQRDRALGAFANHEAPFEQVVQDLQQAGPARVLMHTHLLFQRAFMQPAAAGDLKIQPLRSVSPGSTLELTFGIVERQSEGIRLQMEYRTSLYRRETIARFLLHFQQVLEAGAAHPETPIAELPLFAENEREEIEARLASALHGATNLKAPDVFASLDRQMDEHILRSQETFVPVAVPPEAALAACLEDGQPAPLDIPSRLHLALAGSNEVVPTPFLGRNTDGGSVEIWGRQNDLVRVQGYRLNRRVVEAHLRQHPFIADAAAGTNGRLFAQVVLRPGVTLEAAAIRDWLKPRISDLLVPAAILIVPAISRDGAGEVVGDFADTMETAAPAAATVPLQALIQQQLLEIWHRLLKARDLTIDSNFFESGGNSFLALRMITEAEKLTRQTLPLSLLLRGATVRALAQHILEGANEKAPDIIPVQPAGTQTPLFFLHGDWIGGGFYCNRLARDLGDDQPFFALPPFHMREERIVTMQEMARHHVTALRRERPHGPYRLGGYCIGAAVSVEAARILLAEGETVEHIFLVDPPLWGGVILAGTWPWIDRMGDRRSWDLRRKIDYFDRTAVALGRWWRKPVSAKFEAALHRLGITQDAPAAISIAGEEADQGGAQILDGLDFSTYYLTYRQHRFTPLAAPVTLLFPGCMSPRRLAQAVRLARLDPSRTSVALVAGNHTTCITEHTDSIARAMQGALVSA